MFTLFFSHKLSPNQQKAKLQSNPLKRKPINHPINHPVNHPLTPTKSHAMNDTSSQEKEEANHVIIAMIGDPTTVTIEINNMKPIATIAMVTIDIGIMTNMKEEILIIDIERTIGGIEKTVMKGMQMIHKIDIRTRDAIKRSAKQNEVKVQSRINHQKKIGNMVLRAVTMISRRMKH